MNLFWVPLLTLIGSFVPLFAYKAGRTTCALATAVLPLIALLGILLQAPQVFSGESIRFTQAWVPMLGLDLSFRLDGLSLLFSVLILGIGLLVIAYARFYLSEKDHMGRFYSYLMLFMTAMVGIVLSNNLLQLWFFWELTSLSSFLLIGFWSHKSEARKGARMALTITGLGGLCLLAGILLIGDIVGSMDLDVVLASGDLLREHGSYLTVLILVLLGAFTKSAQFPFHYWLPHAMAAPTPVSAYLHSATMVKAGVFLLARMFPVLAGTEEWFYIVSLTGLVTLLVGSYVATFKHDLKSLLAYSTISHLGLITLLLGLGTQAAAIVAVFHIINHATFKAALFMAAGIIDHETGTRDMRILSGLLKYMPQTAILVTIAAASMAGLPLLNGFLSKEMFFTETVAVTELGSVSWLIPVLAIVGAAFSVAYSLRLVHDIFFNGTLSKDIPKHPHEAPKFMRMPIEFLVALCVLIGLFPAFFVGNIVSSAATAVTGAEALSVKLYLWHGFNIPLLMSALAIGLGAFIYVNRHRLFAFQAQFPRPNEAEVFDSLIKQARNASRAIVGFIDTGSLQRAIMLLLVTVLVLVFWPLMQLVDNAGTRPQLPVDPMMLAGMIMMCTAAFAAVFWHHVRLLALLLLSIVGLIVSIFFALMSAPDLALTQLSVEVVTTVLLLLALYFLPQRIFNYSSPSRMVRDATIALLVGVVVGTINYAVMTRPLDTISEFYLANAKTGGGGTNVVNVILVDFRGFDTFGEITVLAIAALGIFKLLARMRVHKPTTNFKGLPWAEDKHPVMFEMISQALLPLALLFSVYIFLRGHNLPGGGFIAGLISAIAIVHQYIVHGHEWMHKRMHFSYLSLIAFGLLIATLTGIVPMLLGYPFLTSWYDYIDFPLIGEVELASAIAFDLGVFLTVIGSVLMILVNLGSLTSTERAREEEIG